MADPSLPGYPQNSFGLVRCPDEPRKVLYSFVSRRESRWKGTCRLLRRLPQSWWLSSETTISGTMYTPIMASLQRRFVRGHAYYYLVESRRINGRPRSE